MKRPARRLLPFTSIKLFLLEFLIILVTLVFLMITQATLYGIELNVILASSRPYLTKYLLYWGAVTFILVSIITWFRYRMVDKPVADLSRAIKQVAEGDFSIYLKPLHASTELAYIDAVFEDFNKMVAELGSIETMKTDFISNVSHEIKTPLAIISNYAQMLRRENLSPKEREECIDTILANTHRLAELVTNILKLNKIENQVIQPKTEAYNLCAQLSECALLFEDQWEKKHIDFEFDADDRCTVYADREMMEIVWNNLLNNAIKFTPEGGTVSLTQTTEKDAVIVTVSDTGCGMSQETMSHIFDKFYQGDTSHSTPGNGLGLALALRILQISGGTITVASKLGEGSAFTVRLPIQSNHEESL